MIFPRQSSKGGTLIYFWTFFLLLSGVIRGIGANPMEAIDLGIAIFMPDYIRFFSTDNREEDLKKALDYLMKNDNIPVRADCINLYCQRWRDDNQGIMSLKSAIQRIASESTAREWEFDIAYLSSWLALLSTEEESHYWVSEARERFNRLIFGGISSPWFRIFNALSLSSFKEMGRWDGNDEDFYKDLEKAVFLTASDGAFNYILGGTFKYIGYTNPAAHKIAAIQFEKAHSLAPENRLLTRAILGHYEELRSLYQLYNADIPFWLEEHIYLKRIALDPMDAVAHNNLAYLYTMVKGKEDQALKYANRACELEGNNPAFVDTLGWALYVSGDIIGGESTLRKAIALSPDDPDSLGHLATLLVEGGKEAETIEIYEKLVVLEPQNAVYSNNLGYILGDLDRDLERALSLCERANALEPDNPVYLDSLGWVHYKLGQYEKAIEIFDEICSVKEPDPAFFDHRAHVELAMGNSILALESLSKVIMINPMFPNALERFAALWAASVLRENIPADGDPFILDFLDEAGRYSSPGFDNTRNEKNDMGKKADSVDKK